MSVVQSFRYPLERLDGVDLAGLLPPGARVVYHVEVEAATYPAAIALCAEASRRIAAAALPVLAWRDGDDVCPGCRRPVEAAGDDEGDVQGSLL